MVDEPGAGRDRIEALRRCGRHRREVDDALLETERARAGVVQAGQHQHLPQRRTGRLHVEQTEPFTLGEQAAALVALAHLEAVRQAQGQHLGLDVLNLQQRGARRRARHEAAGLAAALDHAGPRQLRQHLVDRHARAAVGLGQRQFGRDAMARRPGARDDAALDIGEDALVQRSLWCGFCDGGARCCGRRRRRRCGAARCHHTSIAAPRSR